MLPAQDIFLKQLEVRIKKERTVEVTIEEGWYSEQEMVSELHWTKNLGYIFFGAANMLVLVPSWAVK